MKKILLSLSMIIMCWSCYAKPIDIAGKWYVQGRLADAAQTSYQAELIISQKEGNYFVTGIYQMDKERVFVELKGVKAGFVKGMLLFDFRVVGQMIYLFYPNIQFVQPPEPQKAGMSLRYQNNTFAGSWKVRSKEFPKIGGQEKWSRTRPLTLQANIELDQPRYTPEAKINYRFTLTNPGSKDVTLHFSSSQQYDIEILDNRGNVLWQWSNDQMFAMMMSNRTLKAGETWEIKGQIEFHFGRRGLFKLCFSVPSNNFPVEATKEFIVFKRRANISAIIFPSLENQEAVLQEVEKLQKEGALKTVEIMKSSPVQIKVHGSREAVRKLQKMAAQK